TVEQAHRLRGRTTPGPSAGNHGRALRSQLWSRRRLHSATASTDSGTTNSARSVSVRIPSAHIRSSRRLLSLALGRLRSNHSTIPIHPSASVGGGGPPASIFFKDLG